MPQAANLNGKLMHQMITRWKPQTAPPYSLHDMIVRKISCKKESVVLKFLDGYVSAEEPDAQVKGKIILEKADMDFSCVLLLSKNGKYGKFKGKKRSLKDFIKRYGKCRFEITEELYGFHQAEYIGWLHLPKKNRPVQMSLSVCFDGDIVYQTEE